MKVYLVLILTVTLLGSVAISNAKEGATRKSAPSLFQANLEQP